MYPWNNKKRLDTLKVKGKNGVLIFKTYTEKAEVFIESGDIAKVVFTCEGKTDIISKEDRHHIVVGEGNAKRDVYHYLRPGGPAPTFRIGITHHSGLGTWSSLPHDFELRTEPGFEEVFFYILQGGPQRAIQLGRGKWYDGTEVDGLWFVYDHTWSTVPMGYHTVVGEPGVHVSYVWAYLAKKKEWEKI